LPRMSKLAAAMYPDRVPENIRRQMVAANPGMKGRVPIEPEPTYRSKVPMNYENAGRIPGLVAKRR